MAILVARSNIGWRGSTRMAATLRVASGEQVGIEPRRAGQREHFARVDVEHDDRAAVRPSRLRAGDVLMLDRPIEQLLRRASCKLAVDREHDVAGRRSVVARRAFASNLPR